jgi:hypothetical protein
MSGPTYFAPVLESFMQHIIASQGKCEYNVMLLITDGTIHDMERTKQLLAQMSHMPCSVIIVGVGDDEDFEEMEELDGDTNPIPGAVRDIV